MIYEVYEYLSTSNVTSCDLELACKGLLTWYRIEFDPKWKTTFGTVFTWKCFRTNSYRTRPKKVESPQKGSRKPKKRQDYMCADRDVSWSRTRMSFDLRLYDSGIGYRTGMKVSIQNENLVRTRSGMTSLSFLSHVNTVCSRVTSEGDEETWTSSFRIETRSVNM